MTHKIGTSGTNKDGLTDAVNDVGYVALPNGKYIAISVFVGNSTESMKTNEQIIAEIAKSTYDHFVRAN